MSELYQEIVALAEQIRTNTAEGSNTAELVGSTLKKIADYIKTRMMDEAEEAANDYTDGQVAAEAAARQSTDQTLQGNIGTEASARQSADQTLKASFSRRTSIPLFMRTRSSIAFSSASFCVAP